MVKQIKRNSACSIQGRKGGGKPKPGKKNVRGPIPT